MKHQYFGDVNDYVKYGILRRLVAAGRTTITACWMLTPDEPENRDGRRLGYLRDASWRVHDPELYDFLRAAVVDSRDAPRRVSVIERSGLLRGVRPFSRTVPDDVAVRALRAQHGLATRRQARPPQAAPSPLRAHLPAAR